jgi:hypothetical protein
MDGCTPQELTQYYCRWEMILFVPEGDRDMIIIPDEIDEILDIIKTFDDSYAVPQSTKVRG